MNVFLSVSVKQRNSYLVFGPWGFGHFTGLRAFFTGLRSTRRKTKKENGARAKKKAGTKRKSAAALAEQTDAARDDDDDDGNYANDGNSNIPTTGYSLSDMLEGGMKRERFEATLTPVFVTQQGDDDDDAGVVFRYDDDGFPIGYDESAAAKDNGSDDDGERRRHDGVARIDTLSTLGEESDEPTRWILSLDEEMTSYAMVDLPPYSDRLAGEVRAFMDPEGKGGEPSLDVILLTSRECVHYDTSPAVYATRKSDVSKWRAAFPDAEVVMYRLDVPRECRDQVTQVLDGYGPWGWDDEEGVDRDDDEDGEGGRNDSGRGEKGTTRRKKKFVETGRPLWIEEWDEEVKSSVLDRGEVPPDDRDAAEDDDDDSPYSPRAIREREGGYRLLAAYTPGHTFGSVSYIFPRRGICCSGYALPVETSRQVAATGGYDDDDDSGVDSAGLTTATPPRSRRGDRGWTTGGTSPRPLPVRARCPRR